MLNKKECHTEDFGPWVSSSQIFKCIKLTSLDCHVASLLAMTSRNLIKKSAAMFGLDARIALAIFGALSVITGAALYSAIGNAKATALLTEMQEVGKAWEQYYLDTGVNLPRRSETTTDYNFYSLKVSNLVKNVANVSGWKGPYTNHTLSGDILRAASDNDRLVLIQTITDSVDWTDWKDGFCTSGKPCFLWIYMNNFENEALAKLIDAKIDSSDGAAKGDFRWEYNATYKYRFFLKYAPIKNPND